MANVHQNFTPRQDFDSYGSQLAVFKVQINCCKDCPNTLKTKLLQIFKGIESVEVDERRNVVTVKGVFDSKEILEKLEKWGKKSELMHERKETNPNGYRVELAGDEEEEEETDLSHDSFRHKDSSFGHKDSSFRHMNSPNRHNDPSNRARDSGSSRAPETTDDNSESNAYSGKEFPNHICRDRYCTTHKRENTKPDTKNDSANNSVSHPPMFHGGHYYGYPYVPPTYGLPPPPPWPLPTPPVPPNYGGQYYGPGMMPPAAGYGHFGYSNNCNIM